MQHPVDWVKRYPNPMPENSDIDIRPVYALEDFVELDPQGDLRDHENAMTRTMELQQACLRPYLFFSGRCEEALDFHQKGPRGNPGHEDAVL